MKKRARHSAILERLSAYRECNISELATQFSVSGETIRRDIKSLSEKGLVQKVHGGVVAPEFPAEQEYRKRLRINAAEKKAIAELAAARILNGASLMLDTGTTTAYLARALVEHQDLLVVTNCAETARILATSRRNHVYLAGGEFRPENYAAFGASAVRFLESFRVDFAILSIGGIHSDAGFMDYRLEEAELAQTMMKRARQTIVLADHSKFDLHAPVWVADFNQIDWFITDASVPPPFKQRLMDGGVKIVVPEAVPEHARPVSAAGDTFITASR